MLALRPHRYLRVIAPHRILLYQRHSSFLTPSRQNTPDTPAREKRGRKTIASLKLDDLPQEPIPLEPLVTDIDIPPKRGSRKKTAPLKLDNPIQDLTPLEPLRLDDDAPAYPTVVLQARNNMRKFENCVLLTRVGGFYELYFEHADEFGPLLNLKVAQKKTIAGSVSMVSLSLTSWNM